LASIVFAGLAFGAMVTAGSVRAFDLWPSNGDGFTMCFEGSDWTQAEKDRIEAARYHWDSQISGMYLAFNTSSCPGSLVELDWVSDLGGVLGKTEKLATEIELLDVSAKSEVQAIDVTSLAAVLVEAAARSDEITTNVVDAAIMAKQPRDLPDDADRRVELVEQQVLLPLEAGFSFDRVEIEIPADVNDAPIVRLYVSNVDSDAFSDSVDRLKPSEMIVVVVEVDSGETLTFDIEQNR